MSNNGHPPQPVQPYRPLVEEDPKLDSFQEAIEEFLIGEMRKVLRAKFNEVAEDVLVKAMQQVQVNVYRKNYLSGINFDVTIDFKENEK